MPIIEVILNNRIPQSFISDLLTRVDIVELIDRHVPLKKSGRDYSACCPFHQEKTPSFTVSPDKQFYHCFGCGAHGTAIGFLIEHGRYEFLEAVEELAKSAGLTIPRTEKPKAQNAAIISSQKILAQAAKLYHAFLDRHPSANKAREYLKHRGISIQIQQAFMLGFAPAGWDTLNTHLKNPSAKTLIDAGLLIEKKDGHSYDRFRERIMFPIRNRRGTVIGFGGRVLDDSQPKYLNSPETHLFKKNRELYGLHEAYKTIHEQNFVLLVEGYMDVIGLAQHDIQNAVATLGTASNQQHFTSLFKITRDIICCFDGDSAGYKAAWRALEAALPILRDGRQIKFMFLPKGEDPDSLVKTHGKEQFLQQINAAKPLAEFFIAHLSQNIDLDDIAGRVRLAKNATTLLKTMPNGLHKDMLLEELGKHVAMNRERLETLSEEQTTQPVDLKPKTQNKSVTKHQKPSAMRLAIALLLQHPHLIQHVPTDFSLDNLNAPGKEILLTLITLLRQNNTLNPAALVEHWRDQTEQTQLTKLLLWENLISAEGLAIEFQGSLNRIQEQQHQQQIQHLLDKANQIGLEENERNTLRHLIKQKNTIQ